MNDEHSSPSAAPETGLGRRRLLSASALLALGSQAPLAAQSTEETSRLHVVCVGGHPDDPETGCGGTLRRYVEDGHRVTVVYLTRGEAGIRNTPAERAAAIRSAECEEACRILGAAHRFAGQIDGATEITASRYKDLQEILTDLAPDVLLTHWPVDTHPDHANAGNLAFHVWDKSLPQTALYFFEVLSGHQSLHFHPTDYVDISGTRQIKKRATYCHKSQKPEEWYAHHEKMEEFRGLESGADAAEGFVHVTALQRDAPARRLPPV